MLSLKVVAMKTPNHKKVVRKCKNELKSMSIQVKKVSEDERQRVKEIWKLHKDYFIDQDTMDVIAIPVHVIDDFFENK